MTTEIDLKQNPFVTPNGPGRPPRDFLDVRFLESVPTQAKALQRVAELIPALATNTRLLICATAAKEQTVSLKLLTDSNFLSTVSNTDLAKLGDISTPGNYVAAEGESVIGFDLFLVPRMPETLEGRTLLSSLISEVLNEFGQERPPSDVKV